MHRPNQDRLSLGCRRWAAEDESSLGLWRPGPGRCGPQGARQPRSGNSRHSASAGGYRGGVTVRRVREDAFAEERLRSAGRRGPDWWVAGAMRLPDRNRVASWMPRGSDGSNRSLAGRSGRQRGGLGKRREFCAALDDLSPGERTRQAAPRRRRSAEPARRLCAVAGLAPHVRTERVARTAVNARTDG